MKQGTAESICKVWDELETAEPDISTERLMATTSAESHNRGVLLNCDDGDVCEALQKCGKFKKEVK